MKACVAFLIALSSFPALAHALGCSNAKHSVIIKQTGPSAELWARFGQEKFESLASELSCTRTSADARELKCIGRRDRVQYIVTSQKSGEKDFEVQLEIAEPDDSTLYSWLFQSTECVL